MTFRSSGIVFEAFTDLGRLRPCPLYPADSPTLDPVSALRVAGFTKDMMPSAIVQRLTRESLIDETKIQNVIVFRRSRAKDLHKLGGPAVDSILLVGGGVQASTPSAGTGSLELSNEGLPGVSWFKTHNPDAPQPELFAMLSSNFLLFYFSIFIFFYNSV